ncbi:NAD(P)-dependent oxidoreductase [Terasakiella sp. A23]|uniref:NAD(P)-dependent oxidoreductase n=1 Tax=Terasakiella sp. FCG-A23 TaxID=3080561 RepID=UPI0029541BC2|nr:NAD(P)-dependent oxidoreductase [Terasakiella sp. A23]MDV7340333.1 NAD(P)-dependent oxidoreductase [Terasakiella sp. A23]
MSKIAFLGLGLMGQGMAANMLRAGYDVTVWNRTASKAKALIKHGARLAQSPAACVEGAEVMITILGDDAASQEVWLGEDGILSGNPAPGAIAIESTTVSHEWVQILGEKCSAQGLGFLDCPVTGGPPGAESGQLGLLVGGANDTLKKAEPILQAYAKKIFHFGPVGCGTAYKLIVNSLGAVQVAALAEAMSVAKTIGLNLDQVTDALCAGSVASRVVGYNAPMMASDDHDEVAFAAKWRAKDLGYGVNMSQNAGVDAGMFQQASSAFQKAIEEGLGEKNESVLSELHKTDA